MAPARQCRRCRQWVSLHLDAELSELETALMQRHLRSCPGCRSFARD
ncbi:MAG: zf-HC2 domain-containing protein, partial [Gaiellaceae bacterium]